MPGAPTPRDGVQGNHGPCESCQHVRSGASIANGTFTVLLPTYQTSPVEQMHVATLKEEAQLAGERESEARENEKLDIENFSRRPTAGGYQYCGLDEFQGRSYICRVKNGDDQHCDDFAPRLAEANRSCATCANLVRPSERALTEIERCISQLQDLTGRDQLLQRIRTALESRAPLEYQSCVLGAGILNLKPGFLSWCRAWSEEGSAEGSPSRFVVGPVVNVGNDCDRWQRATNTGSQEDAELDRLVAQFQDQNRRAAGALGVVAQLQNEIRPQLSPQGWPMLINWADHPDIQGWGGALQWAGRWAAIELITYSLTLLGADDSFITSVADTLRMNLPPHRDDKSDAEWIVWLRWQWNYGQQGKQVPGLRYLPHIAPWQQWLAAQEAQAEARKAVIAREDSLVPPPIIASETNATLEAEPDAQPTAGGSLTPAEQSMVEQMNLSPAELAMVEKIANPEQRAMQLTQLFMQHQSMQATMLTNLAQMRKDMLNAVAGNLREDKTGGETTDPHGPGS